MSRPLLGLILLNEKVDICVFYTVCPIKYSMNLAYKLENFEEPLRDFIDIGIAKCIGQVSLDPS